MLLREVLAAGARHARAGEFSERAFLNGKMDLTQAEAIADLIDAGSEQAARSALKSLQGEFSRQVQAAVSELVQLRLFVEAAIDFPTEEIDFISESDTYQRLTLLIQTVKSVHSSAFQGALLREGITAVIVGKPNAGKSSLLNNLSGRDSAIVTDIPGTTRDILKELIHVDGMPVHVVDTAGLRETTDVIEQEGIRRTHSAMQQADVILWITDASQEPILKLDFEIDRKIPKVLIRNKIDLLDEQPSKKTMAEYTIISLSAKFQQGMDLLKTHLQELVGYSTHTEGVFIARRRHITALESALQFLMEGKRKLKEHQAAELLAEDLRQAQQALNEITGEFSADDLLGKIFGSFCIGK